MRNATDHRRPIPGATLIDWSRGVGVIGHSMGGQATIRSAAAQHVRAHNIKAAAVHHPFWSPLDKPQVAVPIAAFTGVSDNVCPANGTTRLMDRIFGVPTSLRNQLDPAEGVSASRVCRVMSVWMAVIGIMVVTNRARHTRRDRASTTTNTPKLLTSLFFLPRLNASCTRRRFGSTWNLC